MSDWRTWRPDAPHPALASTRCVVSYSLQARTMKAASSTVNASADLLSVLNDLVRRCDGEEGMRSDSSNIDTQQAEIVEHAVVHNALGGSHLRRD